MMEDSWTHGGGAYAGEEMGEWRGGEHYYDGPHDTFCFVCGSPDNLIGCETCDNCYHVECMEPSIDGVPKFWFCPHCAARDWDKPPALCPDKLPCGKEKTGESVEARVGIPIEDINGEIPSQQEVWDSNIETPNIPTNPSPQPPPLQPPSQSSTQITRTSYPTPPSLTTNPTSKPDAPSSPSHHKRKTDPRPNPPHKKRKSKYSPFTSSIEKALGVITNELESVSQYSKTIEDLREKIKDLEQEVRVRDGRLALLERELGR